MSANRKGATIAEVNKAIVDEGYAAELVRDAANACHYFTGAAVERAPSTVVAVCYTSELTVAGWLAELQRIAETIPYTD